MRTTTMVVFATALAALAETKVKMADLPAVVQKSVQAELKTATLVGLSKEKEKGKTYYEAETKLNGKSRDLLFDSAGNLVETEDEVDMTALPATARDAIQKKVGSGKVTKVEALSKGGKLVAYEAAVLNGKKTSEVAVTPEGAPFKD